MMELEVLDYNIFEYSNSFIIRMTENGIRTTYDVRIKFKRHHLSVDRIGIKTGKQREFRYLRLETYELRGLKEKEIRTKELEFYRESVPPQVINLAFKKFRSSITWDNYDAE